MMEDSAVTYVAQVPGRQSMRMATSGVAVLAEFLDKLEGVGRLDRAMGSIKQRARGLTAGYRSPDLSGLFVHAPIDVSYDDPEVVRAMG